MTIKKNYGWIPDVPDQRDFLYKGTFSFLLPSKVDLREFCSKIEDQGSLGSCTAQALAGNIELLDKKSDNDYADVSRLFIYYNERKIINKVNEDSGAFIRDGIKTLAKNGVCSEDLWDYEIKKFKIKPSKKCYRDALKRRISSYKRLYTLSDILSCLAEGYPVVFGISLYDSFQTIEVSNTGIIPMPQKTENLIGGHAVLAVGYDKSEKILIVRNSWGNKWGKDGYFFLPFDYVKSLASDFWTIRK
ncbi:MAG: C1 family peptidase [Novosphingobium sp.]|nr:C1 family peptidase [Novosphingobium sp.]